jgi:hypothetical protein
MVAVTRPELEAAHAWENEDRVPERPAMTEFRRAVRYRNAQWRESHGHPIGTQPIVPKAGARSRLVGSRLPLSYARESGANFLTANALQAAKARTALVEPNQSVDHQRLWADLLWSPALAFNLFGDLAADLTLADQAVHAWFLDAPGRVCEVRFLHSPGWLDPSYLNSLRSFDAAFLLDLDDGTQGIVAVDVNYRERNKAETPRPENASRYHNIANASRAFAPGTVDTLLHRSDLCVMWLEHLLVHAMLQHQSGNWSWGRYLVVHPAPNSDLDDACTRYRTLLADDHTYATLTLEQLLDGGLLPTATVAALRDRYLPQ